MKTTITRIHVSELPGRLRHGREDGFVDVTIADAPEPDDAERLAELRREIKTGDRAIAEGRVSHAVDAFRRVRQRLKEAPSR